MEARTSSGLTRFVPEWVAHVCIAIAAILMLVAAGQPIFTDDTWLHLALGRAFARFGPWLSDDPLLANPLGPPMSAAWLMDVVLHAIRSVAGFQSLRALHVVAVGAIIAFAWSLLRRASGSRAVASALGIAFVGFAAYRLVQLRPHLFSMLATLLLYRLLLEHREPPSARRIVAACAVMAVWANAHAAFLLGPILVLGSAAALALAAWGGAVGAGANALRRARTLGIAGVAALLASLLNPHGTHPHLAWFVAGRDTPELARVGDEWMPLHLFQLPYESLPPSMLAFALFWCLLVATPLIGVWAWRRPVSIGQELGGDASVDPVRIALALAGLAASLVAVRFLWLMIFPLLLVAAYVRVRSTCMAGRPTRGALALAWAGLACVLLMGFVRWGEWPRFSQVVPRALAEYARPYRAEKYMAHGAWLLADAGVTGTAFAEYHMGGFLGYWLAPGVRTLINGTLNVPADVIESNLPLRERRGREPGERFEALLDRHGVDIFMGMRLPMVPPPGRPWFYTTGHLERTPGWIPIYRDLASAIYLRDVERNAENLRRITQYYAEQKVPFDPQSGFDPWDVVQANLDWAIAHGMVPASIEGTTTALYGSDPAVRTRARRYLSAVYVSLGAYEPSVRFDRKLLEADERDVPARRRLVWALLRTGRFDEAARVAEPLAREPESDWLSHRIAEVARDAVAATDEAALRGRIARLPLLTPGEAQVVARGIVLPAARTEPPVRTRVAPYESPH